MMAKISYPTEKSTPGPWLIEMNHLTSVDGLFDEYQNKFREDVLADLRSQAERSLTRGGREYTPEQFQAEVRNLQSVYGRESRSVAVYLKGGKTIASDQFADLLRLPNMNGETAVGFRCDLRVGDFRASISVRSGWSKSLSIEAMPSDSVRAQEFYSALENLVTDAAPSPLQQAWLKYADFAGSGLLFMWVFFGLLIATVGITPDAKDRYRGEIQQILTNGVNQGNQARATQLILAIVSDYTDPSTPPFKLGIKYWGYFVIGLIVLGALRACPGVVIGIWKGKQKIRYWRRWVSFVWVTVPGLILTSVVWPRLLLYLGVK
jgi:hypothetical protein